MERPEIYKALDSERDYQDKKWGGHKHEVAAFITYIQHHLSYAISSVSTNTNDNIALDELRKVAALCVACFEQHDCRERK